MQALGCQNLFREPGGGPTFAVCHGLPRELPGSTEDVCPPGDSIRSQHNRLPGRRIVRPVWLQFILLGHFD